MAGFWDNKLLEAAENGDLIKVRIALENGANPNAKNKYGNTPLHIAAREGHVEVVKLLLECGADPNAKNNADWTPLHIAAREGHVEVVKLLLERGADPNARGFDGHTPLHIAAFYGHVDVIGVLLERGADPNVEDNDGWTPLHIAALWGHVEVVKLLLECGADPNAKNNDGWTPLHIAGQNGHVEVVKLLLERGADPNVEDNDGRTSLSDYSSTGVNEIIPSVPQPLLPDVCSSEKIKESFNKVRDPLEAATAYAFKQLGFQVQTNVYEKNRAGQDVEIDVKAVKKGLEIYASCKNLDRPVDRPTVEQEVGRVNSLKKLPHLKVLVVSSLNDQARETAKSEGFLLVELYKNEPNKKVTEENLDNACIKIWEQLRKYFETLAPPELVSAYTALQGALNSLKNVEEGLKKVITALQKASNKE